MGRKSRLKRERREQVRNGHALNDTQGGVSRPSLSAALLTSGSRVDAHSAPEEVFRFFELEEHAEALLQGHVWISTLETCRRYENAERGDPDEASVIYNSGTIVGDSDNADLQLIAQRSRIGIGPGCTNITLSNNTRSTRIPDAYVLCTTLGADPTTMGDFGKYCVRIARPRSFCERVTAILVRIGSIQQAYAGPVRYADRTYRFLDAEPGPLGFVKPRDKYAHQREYRMLWLPTGLKAIQPMGLECGAVRELVSRVF